MGNEMESSKSGSKKTLLWVILGVIGASAACVIAIVVFAGGIVGVVFGAIRSSEVYQLAVDRAVNDSRVVQALGEPVETGFFTTGSIEVEGASGSANIGIPLKGARDRGTLHVSAVKEGGQWRFVLLELELPGQPRRIDLLAP